VPLLLRGFDPVLLAVGGGAAVTVVTLLLTEGPSRVTWSAVLGTVVALGLTAVLAAGFTAAASFTALQGNEEIGFLIPLVGERIDLLGDPAGGDGLRRARCPGRRHDHPGGGGGAAASVPSGR
jgi:hypothetical protein